MRLLYRLKTPWRSLRPGPVGVLAPALATAVLFGGGVAARAQFVIVPTYDSTITSDPNAAAIEGVINTAINNYEAAFVDPITVHIKFQEMNSGLGSSSTFFGTVSYNTFYNALLADSKSPNDALALLHLPSGTINPVDGSTNISAKTANLRALGINANPPGGNPDGTIGLNTHITDVGSPGSSGAFYLLGVTEHEIDEVLGLGSGVNSGVGSFAEDLFRYDAAGARSFTNNPSAKAFFSIDGTTDLAQFDNQNDGGDWGDWQSNPVPPGVQPKIQDAFATSGAHPILGPEITALDVMGYDPAGQGAPSTTPEPGSLAMLAGFGLTGSLLAIRRRRNRN